jgi:hypothetical protein
LPKQFFVRGAIDEKLKFRASRGIKAVVASRRGDDMAFDGKHFDKLQARFNLHLSKGVKKQLLTIKLAMHTYTLKRYPYAV